METIKEKIQSNIMDGTYTNHPDGDALVEIDLQDFEVALTESLHGSVAELNSRVKYLEMRENDLLGENAVLRENIINYGKENPTENSRNNTKEK